MTFVFQLGAWFWTALPRRHNRHRIHRRVRRVDLQVHLGAVRHPAAAVPPSERGKTFSSVPIGFAPGGECTTKCDFSVVPDTCGACGACSSTLGGSPGWRDAGLTVRPFAVLQGSPSDAICRLKCTFDTATNGGCPTGYTCDPAESVCVDAISPIRRSPVPAAPTVIRPAATQAPPAAAAKSASRSAASRTASAASSTSYVSPTTTATASRPAS